MERAFISSNMCRWSICLWLGIPRALAMASASNEGSRANTAPWTPLPWRLSAYSWPVRHKDIMLSNENNGKQTTWLNLPQTSLTGSSVYISLLVQNGDSLNGIQVHSDVSVLGKGPTFRSMSLIHFMTLWHVQTTGSWSLCSHWARRASKTCTPTTHKYWTVNVLL